MRVLLAAHFADDTEKERVFDMVNNYHHGGLSFIAADLNSQVLNLDVLEMRLRHGDALVIIQSRHMIPNTVPELESEVHRVERLAIECAAKLKKRCGVIGKSPTLLSKHLLRCADAVHIIGPFRETREVTGGLSDSFPVADIVPVSDMGLGVKSFMARLEGHVDRKRRATAA